MLAGSVALAETTHRVGALGASTGGTEALKVVLKTRLAPVLAARLQQLLDTPDG